MKLRIICQLALLAIAAIAVAGSSDTLPKPMPPQLAWQEAELGVMFSYDERVFLKSHRDHVRGEDINPRIFSPTKLDKQHQGQTLS